MQEIKEHYNSKPPRYIVAVLATFDRHIYYRSKIAQLLLQT